ncbi:MAG TPA: ribonuclease P protein component [Arachnia sp.]|nr:ribonuclease P protein component [Arachnia sp.]HMT85179.1 ribonuclease P protein component [Arachnia sp.]
MLPRAHRLKAASDFAVAVRRGSRAATPSVVVHARRRSVDDPPGVTRVGFVVSKKVGNAVTRNRVKRRLRHLASGFDLTGACDVVVRALPAAAAQPERLADDLDDAWRRVMKRVAAC